MKKRILILIMLVFTIFLTSCGTKEVEKKQPVNQNKKEYISFICSVNRKNIYGVNGKKDLIKITDNANSSYGLFDIYDNYIYYTDSDFVLHRINIDENMKDEKLDLTIDSKTWVFKTYGNNLISQGLNKDWFSKIYNLKTKESDSLSFKVLNVEDHLYKDNYYFTDNNQNLMVYNVDTKKLSLISSDSRIVYKNNDYILYSKDDRGVFLYDIETTMSKIVIEDSEYENNAYEVILDNNKNVYFIKNDIFMKASNGEISKLYGMNTKNAYEAEYKMFLLDNNTILVIETDYKEDDCDLGCYNGTESYYYYNTKANKLNEATKDYTNLVDCDNVTYHKY